MSKKKFGVSFFVNCFLILVAIVYFVFLIFGGSIFSNTSEFYQSLNMFSDATNPNVFIRILSYFLFILSISSFVRIVLKLISSHMKRGGALVQIVSSLIKYAAVIVLLFFILQCLGMDTSAILAGIGILGLVVGLGAQPLIADIIAGMFIVFEHIFDVGDIIVVDGFRGEVTEIGIRTTRLVDIGGNVKVINNADIKTLINMTNQLSLAYCDMSIEYGESLERVEAILKDNLDKIKENIPEIVNGPYYKGVSEFADSAVVLRFVAECEEGGRFQVERDLNRQFKLLFDKYNINIPFPQVVVNQPGKFEKSSKKEVEIADKFVKEQKQVSKNLGSDSGNEF